MKKFYSLLIALLCSATMTFAYEARIDGIYYDFDHENKTATVTCYHNNGNYNCYSGNVVVPEYVSYNGEKYIIISIGSGAFHKCENLMSITIPNSVTSIESGAFSDCISLASVEIPSGVTEIGSRAFRGCVGLTSVVISNGVTKIGYEAFSGCTSLLSCTIPSGVRIIEDGVFVHCSSITSIIIPNSVIEIGNYVFLGCTRLSQINVDEDNQNYASIDGVLYDKNITKLICCPAGTNLTFILISNNVTSIGSYAFSDCISLSSITIPNSITEISDYAFYGCTGLMAIEVEKDNQNYASFDGVLYDKDITTFIYCPEGKTSIEIPNSVTSIEIGEVGDFSYNSNLTSINVAENHKIYASVDGVLYDKNIITLMCCPQGKALVTIPNSITSIGEYAFSDCLSLISIEIPNSVTSISEYAFTGCTGLTSIEIPNSVTEIGSSAFYGCEGLISVIIGNNVTSIEDEVFAECIGLTSVEIPNSVTEIGNYAFRDCSSLSLITIQAENPPTIGGEYTFENISPSVLIKVPCASKAKYQTAEYWREFINYEEVLVATLMVDVSDKTMGFATITKPNSCTDDVAQVQAQALAGYEFVRWSDGATENPHILLVTEDMTITAEFRKIGEEPEDKPGEEENHNSFIVESADKTQGTVEITITAKAIEGFEFDHWSDGSTENPRVVTLDEDVELYAYFRVAGTGLENLVISSASVYGNNGVLYVEGVEIDYHVLDAAGCLIYTGRDAQLQLPRGVYMVAIGGEVQKVVL